MSVAPKKEIIYQSVDFLQTLMDQGDVFEIRSLNSVERKGGSYKATWSGYFNSFEKAKKEIEMLEQLNPPAIYVTVNPVEPSLLARSANRVEFRAKNTTSKENILRRKWLFVDIDSRRPSGISATAAELNEAERLAEAIEIAMSSEGWPTPFKGMSGNGAYLFYKVDLPNDSDSEDLIKSVLHAFAGRFDSSGAHVDTVNYNANRICKLLGTMARKGENFSGVEGQEDRPHRRSGFYHPETELKVVTEEMMQDFVAFQTGRSTSESLPTCVTEPKVRNEDEDGSNLEQARKFLAKMEPAIAGEKGHNKTFTAANVLVNKFDLPRDDALDLLRTEYNPRCEPPWSETELTHKIDDALEKRKQRFKSNEFLKDSDLWLSLVESRNDNELAFRFVNSNQNEIRFVPTWRKWLVWDGKHWRIDECQVHVTMLARQFAGGLWKYLSMIVARGDTKRDDLGKLQTFCKSANSQTGIESFLKLARADDRILVTVEDLNAQPYLLNLLNGTFNFKTGNLQPHSQDDLLTQVGGVVFDEDADCPRWRETIELIFDKDDELIRYVQQLLGYSTTGDTGEHILPIAYGSGCNGKSTIWSTVLAILGDYAGLANDTLLMGTKDNHPTEKAFLYQKRFVPVSEPEQSARLKESRVKELTGDSTITARRVHEDYWSFLRTHTFWLSTNHMPRIIGNDEGIWRRIKAIPFLVDLRKVTEVIPNLDKILFEEEGPGILNWLIHGYQDYCQNGFIEPDCVKKETSKYRNQEDEIGNFIDESCEIGNQLFVTSDALYVAFSKWGGKLNRTAFGKAVSERFVKEKCHSGEYRKQTIYKGLALSKVDDFYSADDQLPLVAPSLEFTSRDLANSIEPAV